MEKEEICPVCAEKGITEPRKVKIEKSEGKVIKWYSPCGHKHISVEVTEEIGLKDSISVVAPLFGSKYDGKALVFSY